MDQREDKDSGIKGENLPASPLFIQKQPLDPAEQLELNEQVNSIQKTLGALNEMWKTMTNVFSQREAISIARKEAHLQQAKEKKADSLNVTPGEMEELEQSAITQFYLDKLAAKRYYLMWSENLKKSIEIQRRKVRQSADRWFRFLHRFDDTEKQLKPSIHNVVSWNTIWSGFAIIFCGVFTSAFLGPESAELSEKDPLETYHEKFLEFIVGAYKSYLSYHNITMNHTEDAMYWINSNNSSV